MINKKNNIGLIITIAIKEAQNYFYTNKKVYNRIFETILHYLSQENGLLLKEYQTYENIIKYPLKDQQEFNTFLEEIKQYYIQTFNTNSVRNKLNLLKSNLVKDITKIVSEANKTPLEQDILNETKINPYIYRLYGTIQNIFFNKKTNDTEILQYAHDKKTLFDTYIRGKKELEDGSQELKEIINNAPYKHLLLNMAFAKLGSKISELNNPIVKEYFNYHLSENYNGDFQEYLEKARLELYNKLDEKINNETLNSDEKNYRIELAKTIKEGIDSSVNCGCISDVTVKLAGLWDKLESNIFETEGQNEHKNT